MVALNKVLLIGNLTRDPELRYIPSGTAVAEFGLAVNREYRDRSGERKEDTCFLDIVVWGKQAENCNQYLSKGRTVFIEGRLQFDSWETKEGEKRNRIRIVADRVQFMGGGRRDDGGGGSGSRSEFRGAGSAPRSEGPGRDSGDRESRVGARAPSGGPPANDPGADGGDDLNLDDIPF